MTNGNIVVGCEEETVVDAPFGLVRVRICVQVCVCVSVCICVCCVRMRTQVLACK